jgi:hypothetical protein
MCTSFCLLHDFSMYFKKYWASYKHCIFQAVSDSKGGTVYRDHLPLLGENSTVSGLGGMGASGVTSSAAGVGGASGVVGAAAVGARNSSILQVGDQVNVVRTISNSKIVRDCLL